MAATATASPAAKPKRTAAAYRYASFESRVAAASLDLLVLVIIASLLVTAGSMVVLISSDFERIEPSGTSINIFWMSVGAIAPAWLLYFFVALTWKGQTIGASVMQIMVIRSDGKPLGVLGSIARIIGLLLYGLFVAVGGLGAYAFRDSTPKAAAAIGVALLLVLAGIFWAIFDRHRRALHDRIAGTIVVHIG
jgi:uncharacterized RDD family membrane protein YckC